MARRPAGRLLAIAAAGLAVGAPAEAGDAETGAERARELERRVRSLESEVARLEAELARTRGAAPAPDAWKRSESWRRLRRGMSHFEVYAVLGEPGRETRYDGFERWDYPDFLGGRASFDDAGRLVGWRPPPGLGKRSRTR